MIRLASSARILAQTQQYWVNIARFALKTPVDSSSSRHCETGIEIPAPKLAFHRTKKLIWNSKFEPRASHTKTFISSLRNDLSSRWAISYREIALNSIRQIKLGREKSKAIANYFTTKKKSRSLAIRSSDSWPSGEAHGKADRGSALLQITQWGRRRALAFVLIEMLN